MVIGSGKESSVERQSSASVTSPPMTPPIGSSDLVQLLSNTVLPLLHGSSTSNVSKHDLNYVLRAVIAM